MVTLSEFRILWKEIALILKEPKNNEIIPVLSNNKDIIEQMIKKESLIENEIINKKEKIEQLAMN